MHRLPLSALPALLSLLATPPAHALDILNNAVNGLAQQLLGTSDNTPKSITLNARVPRLTPMAGSRTVVTRGKLSLALGPADNTPQVGYRVRYEQRLALIEYNGRRSYDEHYQPVAVPPSDRLRLALRVTNHGNRVARPKNAIVTIYLDGHTHVLDTAAAQEFLNLLVVPGSARDVILLGPPLVQLPASGGTLRIAIYELAVGDELHNFEWLFTLDHTPWQATARTATRVVELLPHEARAREGRLVTADALPAQTESRDPVDRSPAPSQTTAPSENNAFGY